MRYDNAGTVTHTVSINLDRGERIASQTHAMAWMRGGRRAARRVAGQRVKRDV